MKRKPSIFRDGNTVIYGINLAAKDDPANDINGWRKLSFALLILTIWGWAIVVNNWLF